MGIYTGYFDESGEEKISESFVLGGIVLDADCVKDFDNEWGAIVETLPRKDGELYFHTTDFIGGYDVYKNEWKGRFEQKLTVLSQMTALLTKFGFQIFSAALDMNDYALLDSYIKFGEVAGHPYAMACRIGDMQLRLWAERNGCHAVRMVVENRPGKMGEVVKLFEKDLLLPPVPEQKSAPALQAADLIAWMRFRKRHPNYLYRTVKDCWRNIPKYLETDQIFGFNDFVRIARNIISEKAGELIPARSDPNYQVRFKSEPRQDRVQFKRKAKK